MYILEKEKKCKLKKKKLLLLRDDLWKALD